MNEFRTICSLLLLFLPFGVGHTAGEPWSKDFTPPPGDYSWVQLDTGEWLKGEIIAMYDETLVFDSDHFGDMWIDLSDIEQIRGVGTFNLGFGRNATVNGNLILRGQRVIVVSAGGTREFDLKDLVSITQSVERERDRWTGDIGVGLNVREGNTEISEYSLSVGLRRRTPISRVSIDYIGNRNTTDGELVSDSHRTNLAVDRFTGGRFFWRPIAVQYYRDELQNISHQATADAGIGYQLVDSERVDWEVQAGAGVNYLENVSVLPGQPNGDWSPVGTLGSDLDIEVTSWMDYELLINTTFLEDQAGKYQHHIVSTLSTDLIGGFDLDVAFIWDRTEKPQIDEDGITPEQDDFRLEVSLKYDF
ncbi:MAG: DUF481 domain-containing protein [Woeseiaceae bacterium]|nr:DUF481 domain-containing protein [Woeseiaceae bacterium]NIP20149.1 DUF481 domain-containing protein [Woeseiaceae bacterium]NIS88945.1 DUF481 domain-containing protein [Woeseiaceae bacterium]